MTAIRIERELKAPEISNVYDGETYLGWYGRTEEMGMIEWVAYRADHCRIGSYRGRGAQRAAYAALLRGVTEVERLFTK